MPPGCCGNRKPEALKAPPMGGVVNQPCIGSKPSAEPNSVAAISCVCLVDSITPPEVPNWWPFGAFGSLRFFRRSTCPAKFTPLQLYRRPFLPARTGECPHRLTQKRKCLARPGQLHTSPRIWLTSALTMGIGSRRSIVVTQLRRLHRYTPGTAGPS